MQTNNKEAHNHRMTTEIQTNNKGKQNNDKKAKLK